MAEEQLLFVFSSEDADQGCLGLFPGFVMDFPRLSLGFFLPSVNVLAIVLSGFMGIWNDEHSAAAVMVTGMKKALWLGP